MVNLLVLGGGFGGLTTACELRRLAPRGSRVTLVAQREEMLFTPSLVWVPFGKRQPHNLAIRLPEVLERVGVEFVKASISGLDVGRRSVHTDQGELSYDWATFALGGSPAIEEIPGFCEALHHICTVEGAEKFGVALAQFQQGRIVVGVSPGSSLATPAVEVAIEVDSYLRSRRIRDKADLLLVAPERTLFAPPSSDLAGYVERLSEKRGITAVDRFSLQRVEGHNLCSSEGEWLACDLALFMPPSQGSVVVQGTGLGCERGWIAVDRRMRALRCERLYVVGDAADLPGPKTAAMAILHGRIAAENLAAEVRGREPSEEYLHEMAVASDGAFIPQAKLAFERYWLNTYGPLSCRPQ